MTAVDSRAGVERRMTDIETVAMSEVETGLSCWVAWSRRLRARGA